MSNSQKIDVVLSVLEAVLSKASIPPTWENVNQIHTLYTMIANIGTDLKRIEQETAKKPEEVPENNGETDAE